MLCIAKRITSVKKVMYAIFSTTNELAIQVSIPKGILMNARFYRKQEMSQSRDECPQRNWSSIRHIRGKLAVI